MLNRTTTPAVPGPIAAPDAARAGAHARPRFTALVQSPLRAGLLRYLGARPHESYEIESLMQTFGRIRVDVANCLRELVNAGVVRGVGHHPVRYQFARPGGPGVRRGCWRTSSPTGPGESAEDRSPSIQRFREMIGRDEKMMVIFESIRTVAKTDLRRADPRPDRLGQGSRRPHHPRTEQPAARDVPGGELRGPARLAVRVGGVRLRARRVHGRLRTQARPHRTRQPRHAVPRRGRATSRRWRRRSCCA